ncbi:hypothetical protein NESM_000602800 [Novymonas esmeraldas]|uniref:Uncharacterized protein n=1 Tax=Novymonas esmeraldas TaxID=1808958 RepID=A0AAW0EU94_9TRYP
MSAPAAGEPHCVGCGSMGSVHDPLAQSLPWPTHASAHAVVGAAAPHGSTSPALPSAPSSPRGHVTCVPPASHGSSNLPSITAPFSQCGAGSAGALMGPLASFHSDALRGRPPSHAGGRGGSRSSGLSRGAVLLSSRSGASLYSHPQPSASLPAAFFPLTTEAWQSTTARDGAGADVVSLSRSTPQHTTLRSSLAPSPAMSYQSNSVTGVLSTQPSSLDVTPEGLLVRHTGSTSPATSVPVPVSKAVTLPFSVQSPLLFALDAACSTGSEVSLPSPHNARAPRAGTAKGAVITPAPSSCLPSLPLESQSLLHSPLNHSLTPLTMSPCAPFSPAFSCITGTHHAQSRLSRHRPPPAAAVAAGRESTVAGTGRERWSRGRTASSPPPPPPSAVPIVEREVDETLTDVFAFPPGPQRSRRGPAPSSDDASVSPSDTVIPAEMPVTLSTHDSADDVISATALPQDVEGAGGAGGAAITGFDMLWCRTPATPWSADAVEWAHPTRLARAPLALVPASGSCSAVAAPTFGLEDQFGGEMNECGRNFAVDGETRRGVCWHRDSVQQHRNSVNVATEHARAGRKEAGPPPALHRNAPASDGAIEVKRRSCA